VEGLLTQLKKEKVSAFARSREEIRNELAEELSGRYGGEKERTKVALTHDKLVQTAAQLLANKKLYDKMLQPKK
jgi:hypothetical protein